jgi:hypothetical protein
MVEYLNYSQEKDNNMGVREFRFFHGITIQSEGIQNIVRTLRAQWRPELVDDLNTVYSIDAEAELTRIMSEQISEEIDNEIINILTRRINGGNDNIDYFDRWLNIGNRA